MSKRKSIFFEDWRTCLREHYLHVIRTGDNITEPTLRMVLQEVGFSMAEIDALREEGLRPRDDGLDESPTYQQARLF